MDKIIINKEEVSSYIRIMYNNLNDFKNVLLDMEKKKNEIVWEGNAANKAFSVYREMLKDYFSFANKMMKFVDYLDDYIYGYDELIDEIKSEFNKMKNKYEIEELYGKNSI